MPFGYLRDPLFRLCVVVYLVNRFALKRVWPAGFLHDYLNDVLCIPLFVTIMLWLERRQGRRRHDAAPEWYEVIIPLVVWSLVFEVVLPLQSGAAVETVADPADVLAYVSGALIAACYWRWRYRAIHPRWESAGDR